MKIFLFINIPIHTKYLMIEESFVKQKTVVTAVIKHLMFDIIIFFSFFFSLE